MKVKALIRIMLSAILTIGMAVACSRSLEVDTQENYELGTGDLSLRLCPGLLSTKANAADGYAFHNVLVIIANDANKVVQKAYKEFATSVETDEVTFTDLKVGTYNVYAYANIDHESWQSSPSQTITKVEKALTGSSEGGDLLDISRELKTYADASAPDTPSNYMLLTGYKVLSVGSYRNIGKVELLRPVSRLNVYIHNHTDFEVTLKNLSFSNFNPSKSYILSHWDSNGAPKVPDGTEYHSLPAYDEANPLVLAAGSGQTLAYSHLLWEGAATEDYRMFARVKMDFGGGKTQEKELAQNWVYALTYNEVANMSEGETKEVMVVSPNTKNGVFYGYDGTKGLRRDAQFSTEAEYSALASTILADPLLRKSYIWTLTRTAEGVTIVNGEYNMTYGKDKAYAYLEQGTPTTGEYPIKAFTEDYLFKFRTNAWGHWDFIWNYKNDVGYHNAEKQDGATAGNYMWALYEVKGSNMRLIDNETAQVRPLTQMLRNQELNVVMNVYYKEVSRTLKFELDNAYWTEGHVMSHIYE